MTNDRVSAWLVDLGLGIYRETFKQNAIDWDVLPDLSDGDLEALGVLLDTEKNSYVLSLRCPRVQKLWAGALYPSPSFQAGSHSTQNQIKQNVAS